MSRSLFNKIKEAKVFGDSPFFGVGTGLARILAVKEVESSRTSTTFVIIEAEILSCEGGNMEVGDRPAQRIDMGQKSGPSNLKAFLVALGQQWEQDFEDDDYENFGEDHVNDEFLTEVFDNFPEDGTVLKYHSRQIKTKAGKDFTKILWYPAASEVEED